MDRLISRNIDQIINNIGISAARAGRRAREVKLMAVTKTVGDDQIREALESGITILGENYVQEALKKKPLFEGLAREVEMHMIGHLQTRKAAAAVRLFDMIHSLDRLELARELNKRSGAMGKVTKVLIEVNTGEEPTKGGVSPQEVFALIKAVSDMENLSVQGLMTIPPWFEDPEKARPYFISLRKLKDEIEQMHFPRIKMEELSMGMTADYLVAIEEGSTMVRIGRGIFGERPQKIK